MNNTKYKKIIIILAAVVVIISFFIVMLIIMQKNRPQDDINTAVNTPANQPKVTQEQNIASTSKPEPTLEATITPEPEVQYPTAGWVFETTVIMRNKPTTDSDRVTRINIDTEIKVTEKVKGTDDDYMWFAVEHEENAGYIREDLVVLEKPSEVELLSKGIYVIDEVDGQEKLTQLVYVKDIAPNVLINLTLAQDDNFIGPKIYKKEVAMIQYSTGVLLNEVSNILENQGYQIMLWDGYRPYSASVKMYEVIGDPDLVADPKKGSKHNRGAAVDVTLCKNGKPVAMPTDYRHLDKEHSAISSDMTIEERKNYEILADAMTSVGFLTYKNEWWHFNDPLWNEYPIMDYPLDMF